MHARWGWVVLVGSLCGCVLLGPGADPDNDDETEESGGTFNVAGIGGGVSGTGAPAPVTYSCLEHSTMCRCDLDRVASVSPGRCMYDWTCCIESENADTCECFDSDACMAEIASRPGARQVTACPAGSDLLPVACADTGENCTGAFLEENDLEGCCEGLVCAPNESGVRVCRPGSAEEIALAQQCADDRVEGLTAVGPLATSLGEITFTTVDTVLVNLGADGCVADFSLTLSPGGGSASTFACSLRAQVGPGRDAEGRLLVGGLQMLVMPQFGCTGFPAGIDGLYMGGTAAGTLAYEAFACESGPTGLSSELCTAGRFTLVLDGELTGMSFTGNQSLSFAAATLMLDGRLCDYSPMGSACSPAQ